ncbi:MAG: hypothetical protein L6R38_001587 [Xanthoria sp. 2 TBL-2021]|nr:MAG: hypothetical protein L6R38_001587 [Xanthoria sp. 2 TBL-2021]
MANIFHQQTVREELVHSCFEFYQNKDVTTPKNLFEATSGLDKDTTDDENALPISAEEELKHAEVLAYKLQKVLKATPNRFDITSNDRNIHISMTTYQQATLIDQWKTMTKLLYPANLDTVMPSTDEIIKQGAEQRRIKQPEQIRQIIHENIAAEATQEPIRSEG